MTASFPEFLISLSAQATILLLVTRLLATRQPDYRISDKLWSSCHLLILVLVGLGILLPHLRVLPSAIWPNELVAMTQHTASTWSQVLLCVWCLGCVLLLLAVTFSFCQAANLVAAAKPLDSELIEIQKVFPGNLEVSGRPVGVLVSSQLISPFCWQFHQPVIVLPESLTEFPQDELNAILRHELAHLQAGHPVSLFLQRIVEVLFWFHPLVWSASRNAAATRELACDLNASTCREDAACLLKGLYRLSELRIGRLPDLPAGLAFTGNHSVLQLRVAQLLSIFELSTTTPDIADSTVRRMVSQRHPVYVCLAVVAGFAALIWLPFGPSASGRSLFSPWPVPSAVALKELGVPVRDYEVDAYSLMLRAQ